MFTGALRFLLRRVLNSMAFFSMIKPSDWEDEGKSLRSLFEDSSGTMIGEVVEVHVVALLQSTTVEELEPEKHSSIADFKI